VRAPGENKVLGTVTTRLAIGYDGATVDADLAAPPTNDSELNNGTTESDEKG
jgi:hypothetical protein